MARTNEGLHRLAPLALAGVLAACGSTSPEARGNEEMTASAGSESTTSAPEASSTSREELPYDAAPEGVERVRRAVFLAVADGFQRMHAPREDNAGCPPPPSLPRTPSEVPCEPQPWAPAPGSGWDGYDIGVETVGGSVEVRPTGESSALLRVYVRGSCDDVRVTVYEWELTVDSYCYLPLTPVTYRWSSAGPLP